MEQQPGLPVKTEFEDPADELQLKLQEMKKLVKEAKYIVVYTGAGISTDANIPDYSGDEGLKKKPKPLVVIGLQEAEMDFKVPTYSHLVLTELIKKDVVKFIVTSNHDGLHQRAHTPLDKISDLFGNIFVEKCGKCRKLYHRSIVVPNLGRQCDDENCRGRLAKTGTRMGAMTPEEPLRISTLHSKKADLAIVLGSSMTVSPFCNLPMLAKKTIICTLQETPYDDECTLKIRARCNTVMRELAKEYSIEIKEHVNTQEFALKYRKESESTKWTISITGTRPNEPTTCLSAVTITTESGKDYEMEQGSNLVWSVTVEAQQGSRLQCSFKFKEQCNHEPLMAQVTLDQDSGYHSFQMKKITPIS